MSLEHKKRVIAAVLGLGAIFGIYFTFGHVGLVVLTILLSVLAYWEFLIFSGSPKVYSIFPTIMAALVSAWLCLRMPGEFVAFYLGSLVILFQGLWIAHSQKPESLPSEYWFTQAQAFGLVYLVAFPSFIPKIHALPHGPAFLVFLMGIVWLGDTGAYYGGKLLGKHKLSPNISPGKTLEGAAAALVVCGIFAVAHGKYALPHIQPWKMILIGVLGSIVAQAGDLLESMMKRTYKVKDSGTLIPGHGGVFDRFDSVILAAPFFYFLVRILS